MTDGTEGLPQFGDQDFNPPKAAREYPRLQCNAPQPPRLSRVTWKRMRRVPSLRRNKYGVTGIP